MVHTCRVKEAEGGRAVRQPGERKSPVVYLWGRVDRANPKMDVEKKSRES